MRVNKVELGDEVMFDLNADTVSEDSLIAGTTAHNAVGEPITGTVVVAPIGNELSEESENPVQNKVISAAMNDKLAKTGGTMSGTLVAYSSDDYTSYRVRNIALATTAATPSNKGDILGVY